MNDALKEELKAEIEKFKIFVLLVIAAASGTAGLFLRDDFTENIKVQCLFLIGLMLVIGFLYLTVKSYFKTEFIIDQLKNN